MCTDKTAVALRVLTAINERKEPEDRDVALLRAYCPDHRDLDPDEMACMVIQQALEARKGLPEPNPNSQLETA